MGVLPQNSGRKRLQKIFYSPGLSRRESSLNKSKWIDNISYEIAEILSLTATAIFLKLSKVIT